MKPSGKSTSLLCRLRRIVMGEVFEFPVKPAEYHRVLGPHVDHEQVYTHHRSSSEPPRFCASQSSKPITIIAGHKASGPAAALGTKNMTTAVIGTEIGSNTTATIAAMMPIQSSTTRNTIHAAYIRANAAKIRKRTITDSRPPSEGRLPSQRFLRSQPDGVCWSVDYSP